MPGLLLLAGRGFSAAGCRFSIVPAWLLVRTLGAVDLEKVGSFLFVLTPLTSTAAWIGAGGEVGASDGMIAVVMYRVQWRSVIPRMVSQGRGRCGTLASMKGALG